MSEGLSEAVHRLQAVRRMIEATKGEFVKDKDSKNTA